MEVKDSTTTIPADSPLNWCCLSITSVETAIDPVVIWLAANMRMKRTAEEGHHSFEGDGVADVMRVCGIELNLLRYLIFDAPHQADVNERGARRDGRNIKNQSAPDVPQFIASF